MATPPREQRRQARLAITKGSVTIVAGFLVALALAALFVKLSDEVVEREYAGFDRTVALAVHATTSPPQTAIMLIVTDFGLPFLAVLAVAAAVIALIATIRRARQGEAWSLTALYSFAPVVALGIAGLLALVVKEVVGRARPTLFPPLAPEVGPSFPSGHAITSLAFYSMCAYVLARGRPGPARLALGAGAAALVLAIGYSRVYLGVHYPTDVLGSYLLGLAIFIAVWLALRLIAPHLRRSLS